MEDPNIPITIDESVADKLNGKYFQDLDMNDRLEAIHFEKVQEGIKCTFVGCNDHWGYNHSFTQEYGSFDDIGDTYFGDYISMIADGSDLLVEIDKDKYDTIAWVSDHQKNLSAKMSNRFKKIQDIVNGLVEVKAGQTKESQIYAIWKE